MEFTCVARRDACQDTRTSIISGKERYKDARDICGTRQHNLHLPFLRPANPFADKKASKKEERERERASLFA